MNEPTPRDPLTHQTLAVPVSEQIKEPEPEALRLLVRKTGVVQLQGAYRRYSEQGMLFYRWEVCTKFNGRDIVAVNEV